MRFVPVEGETIPKHCKYGPRRAEGLLFSTSEWWGITSHLSKEHREREMLAILKAKEDAKKEISSQMTRNWKNILTCNKSQRLKRLEKKEKEDQEKINQYNQILKERENEKNKILMDLKTTLYENKDFVKDIKSAIFLSTVIQGRQKQIDLKNNLRKENEKDVELAIKYRKEFEDFERERLEEKVKEKAKRKRQKQDLDEQMTMKNLRRQEEIEELDLEKQDLVNMRIENEKIMKCNIIQERNKKEFLNRYRKRREIELDYERRIRLEEEEEDGINDLYKIYEKKFKEKREMEEKMRRDENERRNSIAVKLAEKRMAEASAKENEIRELACKEKEALAIRELEEKEKLRKQLMADLLNSKADAEEKLARDKREAKERKKWEMIQAYRNEEMDEEGKMFQHLRKKELEIATKTAYDAQSEEIQERRRNELKERFAPARREFFDKEEFLKYSKGVLDFVEERNLPLYPVLKAITKAEKENDMQRNEKEANSDLRSKSVSKENCGQKPKRLLGSTCYCFRY